MADTNTANIGLLLPDLNDTFNFGAHVENNFTTIDGLMGAVQCTSTTRPTNTYAGQIIYETDSKRYVQNTGTKATPAWTYMSHAALVATSTTLPTVGITQGQLVYLTDLGAVAYYSGGAWHTCTLIVCTSTTRPAGSSLQTGSFIYETDTGNLLVYTGSAWAHKTFNQFACTSSTHPSWVFQGTEIYETDTGLSAVYSGSNYLYALGQAAPTQTLSSTTTSITFSGLPPVNAFLVKWYIRASDANAAEQLYLRFNGDSSSSYLWEVNQANNTTLAATTSAGTSTFIQLGTITANSAIADYFSTGSAIITPGGTGKYTTVTGTGSAYASTTNMWAGVYGGQYLSTSTITSLTLSGSSGSFLAGSQVSVYALQ